MFGELASQIRIRVHELHRIRGWRVRRHFYFRNFGFRFSNIRSGHHDRCWFASRGSTITPRFASNIGFRTKKYPATAAPAPAATAQIEFPVSAAASIFFRRSRCRSYCGSRRHDRRSNRRGGRNLCGRNMRRGRSNCNGRRRHCRRLSRRRLSGRPRCNGRWRSNRCSGDLIGRNRCNGRWWRWCLSGRRFGFLRWDGAGFLRRRHRRLVGIKAAAGHARQSF